MTASNDATAAGDMLAAVYHLPPIDWWDGWTYLEDLVVPATVDETDTGYTSRLLLETALHVAPLFVRAGWEGDCRDPRGWQVAPVPMFDGGCQEHGFLLAVKQDNNGTTFLYSPVPLPWLEEYREL